MIGSHEGFGKGGLNFSPFLLYDAPFLSYGKNYKEKTIHPQFFEFASPAALAMMAKKINNFCSRTGPHERLVPMRRLVARG